MAVTDGIATVFARWQEQAELKINVVRPVTTKVALLRAAGQTIHVGSMMATADERPVGTDGTLYAHASTTCFGFDTA
jgi:acyl-coenzyme A thioesterase PaaI-like protein